MTEEYTYTMTRVLSSQDVADLIVTAFEGGINYWCGGTNLVKGENVEQPWYSCPKFYEKDFEIVLDDAEGDDGPWKLTPDAIRRGIDKMPLELAQAIFDEEYDANDADTFIQLCLFGEIVYG